MRKSIDRQAGETVVVSAAAAVGSAAGQMAEIRGCRVVVVSGSPEKMRPVPGEVRLRRGDQLQGHARSRCGTGEDMSQRHRCVFRHTSGAIHHEVLRAITYSEETT